MDGIEAERAYQTSFANSTLLPLLLVSLSTQKHSPNTKTEFGQEYDYIVVGAGSAGSVVASRLSEMPCVRVLLLEAGKAPPNLTEVPGFDEDFYNSDVDWSYKTVPQDFVAKGLPNKVPKYRKDISCQISHPRGKMLGGSSSINSNEYVRGNRKDFDDWAAGGAEGWSYDELLPYFKKMEDNVDPEFVENGYHGVGGPITVSVPNYDPEIKAPMFEAHIEVGLYPVDPNGPSQTGVYNTQMTQRHGQRCSTSKGYLVPKENATNLDIVINALVTKVDIQNEQAVGVWFDIGNRSYYVRASREIIVSAGAINTPQLLMLSGVGPKSDLESLGIPVVADLPVGLNFQDHPFIMLPFEVSRDIDSLDAKFKDENTLKEYINNRSGPLTSAFGTLLHSFANDDLSDPALDFPPIQLVLSEASVASMKSFVISEIYEQVFAPYENRAIGFCSPTVMRPKSRGSIKLQSVNIYDPPIIDLQYLDNRLDFEIQLEGMKLCQRIIRSDAMRAVDAKPFSTLFPGCEDLAQNEDLYLECVATLITTTAFHPVGSVKMGCLNDCSTVVDPQLRVKNIDGLRVADASIMPIITSGNTNVPTIMIGEKAADMIKETIIC